MEQRERLEQKLRLIDVAAGRREADLVLKNAAYVNVFSNSVCYGDIAIQGDYIAGVGHYSSSNEQDLSGTVVLPGLLDAHIHLESSLLSPEEFSGAVMPHGTTTVITDPHEIANVLGTDGITYMLEATEGLPLDVFFMLPSCVPATAFDEAGAKLDAKAIAPFYRHPRVLGLGEMMDYAAVAAGNRETCEKLLDARHLDGHAPGIGEQDLNAYVAVGILTDHECSDLEDALRKLERGQFIMIREGTAAQNLRALSPLLVPSYIDRCLFCCDDRHPSDLLEKGHIDAMLREAVALGVDPILSVRAATLNTARCFGLKDRGAVAPGLLADLAVVTDLQSFRVKTVYKRGRIQPGVQTAESYVDKALLNRAMDTVHLAPIPTEALSDGPVRGVIGMIPGEIVTKNCGTATSVSTTEDRIKLVVAERHRGTGHMGVCYLSGYGLQEGAVATSVAHDSHNLIAAGATDSDILLALNRVAELHGGIVVVRKGRVLSELPLPLGGLMSCESVLEVNHALESAKAAAFSLGVFKTVDPFMTLSFMSLPVIPTLRLTSMGLVDVENQRLV